MREREKKWREKTRDEGRKQIACWLDGDTYLALQALVQSHNLRGMGEAIRLLVDDWQSSSAQQQPQVDLEVGKPGRQPDLKRCECRTARGTRCKSKAQWMVEYKGQEYGVCTRHQKGFKPFRVN